MYRPAKDPQFTLVSTTGSSVYCTGNDGLVTVVCDRNSLLGGCVAEAVRLRAPGIAVRMATCDLAMPQGQGKSVHVNKVKSTCCLPL